MAKKKTKKSKKESKKKTKKKKTKKKKTTKKSVKKPKKKNTEKKKESKKLKGKKEKKKGKSKKKSKNGRYYEATGRRKTAVARVRIYSQDKEEFVVNDKHYKEYFPTLELQKIATASLEKMNCLDKFKVSVIARGGGVHAQAEAVRHGVARALVEFNPDFKKRLSTAGYLTRDPRMRERKKFGLKRARRAPQWRKR